MTVLTPDNIWNYYQKYGIEGLYQRHIKGDLYCVDEPLDCVIVI